MIWASQLMTAQTWRTWRDKPLAHAARARAASTLTRYPSLYFDTHHHPCAVRCLFLFGTQCKQQTLCLWFVTISLLCGIGNPPENALEGDVCGFNVSKLEAMEASAHWRKMRSVLKTKEQIASVSYTGLKEIVIEALRAEPGARTDEQLSALISYFGLVRASCSPLSQYCAHYVCMYCSGIKSCYTFLESRNQARSGLF